VWSASTWAPAGGRPGGPDGRAGAEKRCLDALALREEKTELAALDAELKALTKMTDLVARAR
jgi:hypothetical protein